MFLIKTLFVFDIVCLHYSHWVHTTYWINSCNHCRNPLDVHDILWMYHCTSANICNCLPSTLTSDFDSMKLSTFKRHLKTSLFNEHFDPWSSVISRWLWFDLFNILLFKNCIIIIIIKNIITIVIITWWPSVLWHCWLGGRKGIRPLKNWVVGCWRGYLSGARCRLAYGPADATATHCLLLQ